MPIDNKYSKVTKRIKFYSKRYKITIVVPVGFITDGASIPKILSFIGSSFNGRYVLPAIIHDYLYSKTSSFIKKNNISRLKADIIFLDMMLEYGVKKWKAYLFFISVRIFGWIRFKRKKGIRNAHFKNVI